VRWVRTLAATRCIRGRWRDGVAVALLGLGFAVADGGPIRVVARRVSLALLPRRRGVGRVLAVDSVWVRLRHAPRLPVPGVVNQRLDFVAASCQSRHEMDEQPPQQPLLDRPIRSLLDVKIGTVLKAYAVYLAIGLVIFVIGVS
jgi:hypothetical protein